MALERQLVQIRKKGGLDHIIKSKDGSRLQPMFYTASSQDRTKDGNLQGNWKGKTIIDTKHILSPMWDIDNSQWHWGGTNEDLAELVKKMKLTYPKGHPRAGQLIENLQVESDRLHNMSDDVFVHPDFYGKYAMMDGRLALDLNLPKDKFMYFCHKGSLLVEDKSSDKPMSNAVKAGIRYEITSPRKESQNKRKNLDKANDARLLLKNIGGDEEKMRSIALVMSLPGYSNKTEVDALYILLNDMAVENITPTPKYGGKTYQDRFTELANLTDEELKVTTDIIQAKKDGILRAKQGYYLFNGRNLDHIESDIQLIAYFRDPRNQDQYLELLELKEAEKSNK